MSSEICLELVDSVRYSREIGANSPTNEDKSGILERNSLAWYARGSVLEVFNIDPNRKVISHNFNSTASKSKPCTIECVEEVCLNSQTTVLAVALCLGSEQSQIAFLSLRRCRELGRIDVQEDIRTLRWLNNTRESVGSLYQFSCCLAAGTKDGKVLIVDGCIGIVEHETPVGTTSVLIDRTGVVKRQCHIELFQCDLEQIIDRLEQVRDRGLYVGLQLPQEVYASVSFMLDITPLRAFTVGFDDGSVLLYDLPTLSRIHRIASPCEDCSVVSMDFCEPSDDPKPCLYLWVLYAHPDGAFAVLYLLMCQHKQVLGGRSTPIYDELLSCSERLSLASYDPGSRPLNVQTVRKKVAHEDELITLTVLSWLGSNNTTTLMVFDLNQWYKAEMPYDCDWKQELTYTVVFQLGEPSFHVQLIERSIVLFRSIQRPEEHFYPSSLAFDIMSFHGLTRTRHRWIGLQNKLLQYLDQDGANSIIEPVPLYQMLCRAALVPEFYEQLPAVDDDVRKLREFILSIGLEYNCHTFLQSCMELWADGSHLGANPERGVSLSTLTDWIRNRSQTLKMVTNALLLPILKTKADRHIDTQSREVLALCTREGKQLSKLYDTILSEYVSFIPEAVIDQLRKEAQLLRAVAEYQDVLQWLLHINVLPEGRSSSEDEGEADRSYDESLLLPYPYEMLQEYYRSQRHMVSKEGDESPTVLDLSYSKYLFIDNLLERDFDPKTIRKLWAGSSGKSPVATTAPLYPPKSLFKALRVMLLPEVPLERKLVLLMYIFMDIVAIHGEGRYRHVLQRLEKFPQVFKLRLGLVRRVQAFWHLDHGNMAWTVEEFLSPLSCTVDFPQWHRELAVSVLLHQDASNLALKVLRAPGSPVSPYLELLTLVRNNLISEAFSVQRRSHQTDGSQLICFVEAILSAGKAETLLEFSLTEEEKRILREYLLDCPHDISESLIFGHLLQNFELVEAVQVMEGLKNRKRGPMVAETQREILSLYHKVLDPTSQRLAYLTYTEPKELEPNRAIASDQSILGDPSPSSANEAGTTAKVHSLSSSLIRNRGDFRARVLHRSIVAIKDAAASVGLQHERPFLEKPGLGVFQCRPMVRSQSVSYPVRLDPSMNKRRQRDISLEECPKSPLFDEEDGQGNPRKRRNLGPASDGGRYPNFDLPVPKIPEFRPMKPRFNFTAMAAAGSETSDSAKRRERTSISNSPSIFATTPPTSKKQSPPAGAPTNQGPATSQMSLQEEVPHGILKQQNQSVDSSVAASGHDHDSQEKVLRFNFSSSNGTNGTPGAAAEQVDEMKSPEAVATTPAPVELERRDLDLSAISNDDFYSPEVTIANSSLQQIIRAGCPTRRRPLHLSRSGTPTAAEAGETSQGNNIAIIIEDHLEEGEQEEEEMERDGSSQGEDADEQMDVDEGMMESKMDVPQAQNHGVQEEQANEPAVNTQQDQAVKEIAIQQDCSADRARDESMDMNDSDVSTENMDNKEQQRAANDADEVNRDEVAVPATVKSVEEDDEQDQGEDDDETVDDEDGDYDKDDDDDDDDDDEDGNDDEDDDDDDGGGDDDAYDHVDRSPSEDSVLEVIDVSDEFSNQLEQASVLSQASSSPSASSGGSSPSAPGPQERRNDVQREQQEESRNAAASPAGSDSYGEFYHESEQQPLYDELEEYELIDNDQSQRAQEPQQQLQQQQQQQGTPATEDDGIQVPTTSSSTHRTEQELPSGTENHPVDGEESSEVKDLSVQLLQDPSDVEVAPSSAAARNLSVVAASEECDDGVASTSDLAATTTTEARVSASIATNSSSPPSATSPTQGFEEKDKPLFGQPKNAHELEVPAMNLCVKPDEAHGSSRKNSKGEENGLLTVESRALNLSADQQELAAHLENVTGTNEGTDGERNEASGDESEDYEAHSSSESKLQDHSEANEEEATTGPTASAAREISMDVMEKEDEDMEDEPASDSGNNQPGEDVQATSSTVADPNQEQPNEATENPEEPKEANASAEQSLRSTRSETSTEEDGTKKTIKPRLQALVEEQQDQEMASTSSPRTNVKTRLMAAMEKSGTPSLPEPTTPSRRRSVRASSVLPESTNTPLTPALSRSRRYASMDNVTGTPETPLTPRRSTRATSLVKELFGGVTPQKKSRRQSQASSVDETTLVETKTVATASATVTTEQNPSLPSTSPTVGDDPMMEPPEPSERSFASSTASSIRRSTRGRKSKAASEGGVPEPPGPGSVPPFDDYSSNRRLTRHQLAVMERSMGITAAAATTSGTGGRTRRASSSRADESMTSQDHDSEPESVASSVSGTSLRSTRSRTARSMVSASGRQSSIETRSNRGGSKARTTAAAATGGSITGSGSHRHASEQDSDSDNSTSTYASNQRGLAPIAEEESEAPIENVKKRRTRKTKGSN
ncbi:protein ELYS [Anopheles aquasalis]|uniref:protein ELYS n=1 Tax=Anopheles aquasalis TaxID=42839 RepID=UPI00215AF942|nr:protein ELYS [Anopheles aquasalis]